MQLLIFKYNSSTTDWEFNQLPNSLSIDQPIIVGTDPDMQESVTFSGAFDASNLYTSIIFHISTEENNTFLIKEDLTVSLKSTSLKSEDSIASSASSVTFHTFTDVDLLPVQDPSNAYGSTSFGADASKKFRLCNLFTGGSGILKVYAATSGEVFIQEVKNEPDLVNLILKPDNQPLNNYTPVKYFVYRGLKKSHFLSGSDVISDSSAFKTTDLMKRMWEVRKNINADKKEIDSNYVDEKLERADLGLYPVGATLSLTDDNLIANMFDLNTFQRVQAGWFIGEFETSKDYGFEIMLDGNYKHTLADVREKDHILEITGSQYPAAESIETKLKREKILSYLDAAAYMGMITPGKVVMHETTGDSKFKPLT